MNRHFGRAGPSQTDLNSFHAGLGYALGIGILVVAMLTGGCRDVTGGSRPVATVSGMTISVAEFAEQFRTLPGAGQFGIQAMIRDTPNLDKCISERRRRIPAEREVISIPRLRRACAYDFAVVKAEVMRRVIVETWLRREARRRYVAVSKAEVNASRARMAKQFASLSAFRRYLSQAGLSEGRLQRRVKLDHVAHKLMRLIVAPDLTASPSEIARYYEHHKFEFDVPPGRHVRTVVTKTKRRATEARAALERDRSWDQVVRRYSQDLSKRNGGRMPIGKDNAIKKLRDAVFRADRGELVGPVYIRPVWWVFTVGASFPARQLPLREVRGRIRSIIRSTRESRALDKLTAYLMRTYRPQTVCSPGFDARECRNRPRSQPLPVPR